ncbi:MAG: hypothetical protein WA152_03140 [Microgenomates group bacterium]
MDSNTWSKLISAVKEQSMSIGGLLSSAHVLDLNDNNLKLGVYYKFHKDKLEEAKTRKMLEDACLNVLGNDTRIEFCLAEAPVRQQLTEVNNQNIITVAEQMFS